MAGPWEQYQSSEAPSDGPWTQYQQPEHKFGLGDTWPAKLAKSIYSAVTLPGDVYQGNTQVDVNNPEFMGRVTDLAGLGTPVTPKVAPSLAAPVAAKLPTAEELHAAANQGYDTARAMGVDIKPEAIAQQAQTAAANLDEKGANAILAPKTHAILSGLGNPPPGSVATIANLESARRALGNAAKDFTNPTEQFAAKRAQQHLDDYLSSIPQSDVLAGDAQAASKILDEARKNKAAAFRSDTVTGKVDEALGDAEAANSYQNQANTIKKKFNAILKSDKQSSGFDDAELEQMKNVRRAGRFTNIAGNLMGGGGGLGAVVSGEAGKAALGPLGYAVPAVGWGLKKASNAAVYRQVAKLDAMTRARSPLAQAMGTTSLTPADNFRRELLIRSLLASPNNGP